MALLILGVALWILAHLFKRIAPDARASLGSSGKGIVTAALIAALILIILGYRMADFIPVWTPPSFMVHINNLLMLCAVFVFASGHTTGRLRGWLRHPMLHSVKIWATAHLLVNGDLASIILFGSLLCWAVATPILINRAEPDWTRPEPGDPKKDVLLAVITLVAFVAFTGIHTALGVWPFPS